MEKDHHKQCLVHAMVPINSVPVQLLGTSQQKAVG